MALAQNLTRLIQVIKEDSLTYLEEIQELILETPENEIPAAVDLLITLCHKLTESLIKSKRSVSGIHLISQAIPKIQSHPFQLTPIHSDLCLLCLDSKAMNPALPFLETVYTDIKKTDDKDEDAKNVMLFFYYGGLIYAAAKNFERASHFFEIVLKMPAYSISPVMSETYKKQVLINILIHGKLQENILPKYISSCLARGKKVTGNVYTKLAQEYSSLNYEKIQRYIETNSQTFERDDNMGLINQCLTQVHRRNIQRLTKTFLTLSLRDVAEHVGLPSERDAESYILNMIDDGEIFATINQKDGMVVFEDSSENFDTVTVFRTLQEDISKTSTLITVLKKLEAESANSTKAANKLNESATVAGI